MMTMKGIALLIGMMIIISSAPATNQTEFEKWLVVDQTNEHKYITGEYMCLQFADNLIKNATNAGFRDVCLMITPNRIEYEKENFYITTEQHALVYVLFENGGCGIYEPATDENVYAIYMTYYTLNNHTDVITILMNYRTDTTNKTMGWYNNDDVLMNITI